MSFTSSLFLIGLLPWLILLVFLLRNAKKSKYLLVFLANCIFYIWNGVGFFVFICVFSFVIWLFTVFIAKNRNKTVFAIIICISLLPLILCKYSFFAVSNINNLLGLNINTPDFIMPLGISFFTFEAISLLTDVFRQKIKDRINFWSVLTYISFFPTVTSGPILRYNDFNEGMLANVSETCYSAAIERTIIGLCKKVLIADKIAVLSDFYFNGISNGNTMSTMGLWIGSAAYSLQLYYDFSGYSDMAIGIGQLLGFHIPENFNKPYQAKSISEFWRRWHISLSQWFRDYVYIPLGGNRCSIPRHVLNMFAVWILTGMWHGADWSFIIWGLGYFVLLIMEKYIPLMKKICSTGFGCVYTLLFVNLLWIPFRAQNLSVAVNYLLGMIGVGSTGSLEEIALNFIPFTIVAVILCCPIDRMFLRYEDKKWFRAIKGVTIIVLAFISICAVINSAYSPYIYGNF